ncbi:hypothetical protein V8C42DRAFT_242469 [Trichoderma barbatum]
MSFSVWESKECSSSHDIATGWGNVYRIYNQAIYIAESGVVCPGRTADADLRLEMRV